MGVFLDLSLFMCMCLCGAHVWVTEDTLRSAGTGVPPQGPLKFAVSRLVCGQNASPWRQMW